MKKEKKIIALGFFDGVHLGHAALLTECHALAARYGLKTGVATFSSHPDALVLGKIPGLINTAADREWMLREKFHMDSVIALPFDEQMRIMHWKDFLNMLIHEYGAAGFVCGEDFRFGNRGEGNARILYGFCEDHGFPCAIIPQMRLEGEVVSSTHIRKLLETGGMETAVRFLGHPHILTGTVVPGRQLGRTIGVPTANLHLPPELLVPKFGVYACLVRIGEKNYPAVTNIGTRPTVDGVGVTVEPWILDFSGDLYGREITLEFHKFLRTERKFPSLTALQAEIQKNAAETKRFFKKS